jgi:hypothetical protein
MTTTQLTPQTCYYITLSSIAKISKEAGEAVQALLDSDLDVSFGDANRTLTDIPHFLRLLEDGMEQQGILWVASNIDDDETYHAGYKQILEALEEFDHSTYVDLEN